MGLAGSEETGFGAGSPDSPGSPCDPSAAGGLEVSVSVFSSALPFVSTVDPSVGVIVSVWGPSFPSAGFGSSVVSAASFALRAASSAFFLASSAFFSRSASSASAFAFAFFDFSRASSQSGSIET